jgi:hypothetical protein
MTKPQLHHVQKEMISISLSKWGHSSKTARAVVFGPRQFLGTGDRHFCYEQGIDATLQLLKHIRANSKLGDFLKIGLDCNLKRRGVQTQDGMAAGVHAPSLLCVTLFFIIHHGSALRAKPACYF